MSSIEVGKRAVAALSKQFAPKWGIDEARYAEFLRCLEDIDSVLYENDGTSVEVLVQDKNVHVIMECPSLATSRTDEPMGRLIRLADRIDFYSSLGGDLRVNFNFTGIFKQA